MVPELDAILAELSARTSELRGGEHTPFAKSGEVGEIARSGGVELFPIGNPFVALKNQLRRMLGQE